MRLFTLKKTCHVAGWLTILASQGAWAASAGMCHYMTYTTLQNVSGYDLAISQPNLENTGFHPWFSGTLLAPTGGTLGFSTTYADQTETVGATVNMKIQDGQTNPSFQLHYWSGTGSDSPGSVADAAEVQTEKEALETSVEYSAGLPLLASFITVPPPGNAIIAAIGILSDLVEIAWKAISQLSLYGYLNINTISGGNFASVSGISQDTVQTNTAVIPGVGSSIEAQNLNGYVVTLTAVNNGCPNSWNVMVMPYCNYVCAQAQTHGTALRDSNCATSPFCSQNSAATDPITQLIGKPGERS